MANKGLIDWLDRNKNKGYTKSQLKDYLVKYGYSAADVDDALKSVMIGSGQEKPQAEKKPQPVEAKEQKVAPQKRQTKQEAREAMVEPERVDVRSGSFWDHIHHRNLYFLIIMTIVTCGIYWFYWFWRSSREISMTTGMMPRRGFLIPSLLLIPALFLVAMMLFIASQIDIRASTLFIQYGSLVFVGLTLLFMLLMGTFFWTYALSIQPIISTPAWLNFILLITIAPSILVMLFTQTQLNKKAVEVEGSTAFTRQQAYAMREKRA